MYTLKQKVGKKQKDNTVYDYVFRDFSAFYEVADLLTYALGRRVVIRVDTDDITATQQFIKNSERYSALDVYVYMPAEAIEYITMRDASVNVASTVRMITVFEELIQQRGILFGKGVIYQLYNSIPHDIDAMEQALDSIVKEFGTDRAITTKDISQIFILNNLVYPRTVLLSFLWNDRWRWSKFDKCIKAVGNDVLVGALVKNVKEFVEAKKAYYKTGQASQLIRSIDTDNLMRMYRVLVSERGRFGDAYLLLKLYERGESTYAILHKE